LLRGDKQERELAEKEAKLKAKKTTKKK